MAMNGIGQVDLYNNYINRVEEQDALSAAKQSSNLKPQEENAGGQETPEISLSLNLEGIHAKQNMSLSDVSLTMNQSGSTSFEMKALSYKPSDDEVDKAVSDMQKDSALMKYSYFVGESNVIMDNEDGVVLLKPSAE